MASTTMALTIADLETMPDDGRRYELIGGAIVMTPAPSTVHQQTVGELYVLLRAACPPGHRVFLSPIDLDLPDEQRVEPDLVVVPDESVGPQRLTTPVLLVVEVVSPGSRTNDRVTKRATYAEAGIPHYWLVDLEARSITLLRLAEAGYETVAEGATVTAEEPIALSLSFEALTEPR
jgi:Uma2 family endonuclease